MGTTNRARAGMAVVKMMGIGPLYYTSWRAQQVDRDSGLWQDRTVMRVSHSPFAQTAFKSQFYKTTTLSRVHLVCTTGVEREQMQVLLLFLVSLYAIDDAN